MSDHEHGSMDTSEQEKTFEGFLSFSTKTAIFLYSGHCFCGFGERLNQLNAER